MTSRREKIRVRFLTQTDERGASARLRAYQLAPYLKERGLVVSIDPAGLEGGTLDYVRTALARLLERNAHLRESDVLVFQRDLINDLAPWLERYYARGGVPIILDVDDDIGLRPPGRPPTWRTRLFGGREKLAEVARLSKIVVAGNETLAQKIRSANPRVEVIPTCLDFSKFPAPPTRKFPPLDRAAVIGWVGSPLTTEYLELLREPLETLSEERKIVFRTVGAAPLDWKKVPLDERPWRPGTAAAEVAAFDIGVMPLFDDEWSRAKCGTKILEYFAAGVPVIASPVGMNVHALDEGRAGLLARDSGEWLKALRSLLSDESLYEKLSQEGRRRGEEVFDVRRYAPLWEKLIREAAAA